MRHLLPILFLVLNGFAAGPRTEPFNPEAYAQVLYVRVGSGKEGGADGTKKAPFRSVAEALAAARPPSDGRRMAVVVAEGTYPESGLQLKERVDVFGGFDGRSWARDIDRHRSILDGKGAGPVVRGANFCRFDGFVVTGGVHRGHGGGVLCEQVSPEISNNVIVGNATRAPENLRTGLPYQRGGDGGGIALTSGSEAVVRNNLIARNTTEIGTGGGIAVWNFSKPRIVGNVICNNRTGLGELADKKTSSRSSGGGGISVNFYCKAEIEDNALVLNFAGGNSDAGGIYLEHEGSALVRRNWVVGNYGDDDGGAFYVMKTAELVLEENLIAGNSNQGSPSEGCASAWKDACGRRTMLSWRTPRV